MDCLGRRQLAGRVLAAGPVVGMHQLVKQEHVAGRRVPGRVLVLPLDRVQAEVGGIDRYAGLEADRRRRALLRVGRVVLRTLGESVTGPDMSGTGLGWISVLWRAGARLGRRPAPPRRALTACRSVRQTP